MTDKTIRGLAQELANTFEVRTRENGDTFVARADDASEWILDVIRDAHDDMMPDDWRYQFIRHAAEWIAEDEGDVIEAADNAVSVYHHDRFAWLASNLARQDYVNEVPGELGYPDPFDISTLIAWGMVAEYSEVYGSVLRSLEDIANE